MKPVLTIAGSDCSGGAGIQADLKTMSALGCYGMSVITAVTAQNTLGVTAVGGLDPALVSAQIEAVMTDIPPLAVKTGMLFSADIVAAVADAMSHWQVPHLVIDPVMVSTSGSRLIAEDATDIMISGLFPLAELVTPNVAEAVVLAGSADPEVQAAKILSMGPRAVLLKGGDRIGTSKTDLLFTADGAVFKYESESIDTPNTHGTGCTLSAAIASMLAGGLPLPDAVRQAKDYITAALRSGARFKIGAGHGPVDHFFAFRNLR